MNFKLTSKMLLYVIVAIAVGYILLGLVQALTPYHLETELGKTVDTGFLFVAAGLFIWMQQLRKKENAERDAAELPASESENAASPPTLPPSEGPGAEATDKPAGQ